MKTVVAFKLISGEEIIGKLVESESTGSDIVLEDPVALVMMRTQDGMRGTFMPYVQSNPEITKLSFPVKHFACMPFDVSEEVASAYIQSTSKLDLSATSKPGLKLVTP